MEVGCFAGYCAVACCLARRRLRNGTLVRLVKIAVNIAALDRSKWYEYIVRSGRRPGVDGRAAFAGCVLKCRIIGIIEGEQGSKHKKERNDRVVAVENDNHSWANIKRIDDLGQQFREELEDFL